MSPINFLKVLLSAPVSGEVRESTAWAWDCRKAPVRDNLRVGRKTYQIASTTLRLVKGNELTHDWTLRTIGAFRSTHATWNATRSVRSRRENSAKAEWARCIALATSGCSGTLPSRRWTRTRR